jgi:predicted anti-sigma-YlaC factor YlaD
MMMTNRVDEHVTELIGCYVLGVASAEDEFRVERHLLTCSICQNEAAYVGDVALHLAHHANELAWVGPASVASRPTSVGARSTTPSRSRRRRKGWRWGEDRRTLGKVALLAATFVAVAGIGLGAWLRLPGPVDARTTNVVMTATDQSDGLSAVLVVTPGADDVALRITVRGLHVGQTYQLVVIPNPGQRVVVSQWQATGTTQEIQGTVPVPETEVGLLAIARPNGTVLLSVPFGPSQLVPTISR